jgi:hypothetical protein
MNILIGSNHHKNCSALSLLGWTKYSHVRTIPLSPLGSLLERSYLASKNDRMIEIHLAIVKGVGGSKRELRTN